MRGLFSRPPTINKDTKMFAKKTRIYGIAMQTSGGEVWSSCFDPRSPNPDYSGKRQSGAHIKRFHTECTESITTGTTEPFGHRVHREILGDVSVLSVPSLCDLCVKAFPSAIVPRNSCAIRANARTRPLLRLAVSPGKSRCPQKWGSRYLVNRSFFPPRGRGGKNSKASLQRALALRS
jgi:hypothetical protein